jgi:adenosylmethionine-8-amino-7-oxononanoate aminotransferase
LQARYDFVGDVRGMGMLWGVELVQDRVSKIPFPAEANLFARVTALAREEGLLIYPRRSLDGLAGDHFLVCPPLNISGEEVSILLNRLSMALQRLEDEVVAPLMATAAETNAHSTTG